MGRPEEARILDDVDLTLTLDSRTMSSHQMTSVDITFKPIILRASYRDIMLILTIVNKVMEAYGRQSSAAPSSESNWPSMTTSTTGARRISGGSAQSTRSDPSQPLGTAHVVLSKEQVGRDDPWTLRWADEFTVLAQSFLRWVSFNLDWRFA
jgi:vacuolar protein sorting-associated protein 13A/C